MQISKQLGHVTGGRWNRAFNIPFGKQLLYQLAIVGPNCFLFFAKILVESIDNQTLKRFAEFMYWFYAGKKLPFNIGSVKLTSCIP